MPRGAQGAPAARTGGPATTPALATARWEALGTSVVLRLTDPAALPRARALVARELDQIDLACSRFRTDSDLSRANAHAGGRPVRVSPLLIEALQLALRAAELTNGDVDPTVGAALVLAGYDRDWRLLESADAPAQGGAGEDLRPASPASGARLHSRHDSAESGADGDQRPAPPALTAQLRSGYRTVELDAALQTIRIPGGIMLDLGATAKAWAADRAARAVHEAEGCGVLVSLGGDIATAGAAPADGWLIHVTDDHRDGADAPGQTISIASGGLATSSVAVRRWRRGAATMHHIIDPAAGAPVRGPWRTVSVAAADCADANIASTAALVRGERAPRWLRQLGVPARLVAHSGEALAVGGWPEEPTTEDPPPSRGGRTDRRSPGAHALAGETTDADDPQ
jgi:thiamine biosynthesis lipoprotein